MCDDVSRVTLITLIALISLTTLNIYIHSYDNPPVFRLIGPDTFHRYYHRYLPNPDDIRAKTFGIQQNLLNHGYITHQDISEHPRLYSNNDDDDEKSVIINKKREDNKETKEIKVIITL